jgi:glutamate-1-semialdehyde 2,1-aminomutase
VRAFRHVQMDPWIAAAGEGALVRDGEGRTLIDYCCGWGALLHGHAHPLVLEAVQKRLRDGWIFGLANADEARLAEMIHQWMPGLEMVRFLATGTEAAMTAVRIARAATGRDKILKFGGHYHGHYDSFLVEAGSAAMEMTVSGIPSSWLADTLCVPFNDLEALEKAMGPDVAAVIVEPVATNMGLVPPATGFLQQIQRLTRQHGALLILDEVVTGFRLSRGGAQAEYGLEPDLTILSKVVGGGFPLSVVGGRAQLMQQLAPTGRVFQAGTFAGHPVAVTAGIAALELASHPAFYPELEMAVRRLTDPVEQLLQAENKPAVLQRVGSLFSIFMGRRSVANSVEARAVDRPLYAQLFRFLLERGILAPPSPFECWYVSSAHTPAQLDATREALLEFFTSAV